MYIFGNAAFLHTLNKFICYNICIEYVRKNLDELIIFFCQNFDKFGQDPKFEPSEFSKFSLKNLGLIIHSLIPANQTLIA